MYASRRTAKEILAAALLSASLLFLPGCSKKPSAQTAAGAPAAPPTVIVAPVTQKTVPIYQTFVGQTEASTTIEIRSQVSGLLKQMNFVEGSMVRKGQLLFVIDPQPYQTALAQAKANLNQYKAAAANAQQNLARDQALAQAQVIAQQQFQSVQAQAQQAQANVAAAQAQVHQAQLNLNYTTISAPHTGWIGAAQVKIGSLVQAGSTLLDTLYTIDPIYVTFSISEAEYLEYRKRTGDRPVKSPPIQLVLADGSTYPHTGTINMAAPTVNSTTGTLTLRAQFPNPEALLKPGLFVQVRLVSQEVPNALLVPQTAIQQLQGTELVYVVGPDNKVQAHTVQTGGVAGNLQIVTSGVSAGQNVIVEGVQKVRPGMTVKPETQPATPPATTSPGSAHP